MSQPDVKVAIRDYFEKRTTVQFTDADDLFMKGLLDSFGVVEFLTFLEKTFGVTVPAEDVMTENLHSIDAVNALVKRLL